MEHTASAPIGRRPVLSLLVQSIRRRPKQWILGFGVATAVACGGAGGGGGGTATAFEAARIIFTTNIASCLRFAPDGRIFFCELKTGKVRIISGGSLVSASFAELPVATDGEQGLLGLAFDPDYANNKFVYVFYTQAAPLKQRIVRFTDVANVGTAMTTIVDDLPVEDHHCGGRIGFGQDGKLYVTVGDVEDPANSQNDLTPAGKLLRYEPTGGAAAGNPIPGNPLYAKGLRNPFGLAFRPANGRPYLSENGPTCDDEINRLPVPGANFGWRPGQPCNDVDPNFVQPLVRFNPSIAPTGCTFYTGSDFPEFAGDFFMGSFNDGRIRRYRFDDSNGAILDSEIIISGRPGGVIDVAQGPDGGLYFCDGDGIYRVVRS